MKTELTIQEAIELIETAIELNELDIDIYNNSLVVAIIGDYKMMITINGAKVSDCIANFRIVRVVERFTTIIEGDCVEVMPKDIVQVLVKDQQAAFKMIINSSNLLDTLS